MKGSSVGPPTGQALKNAFGATDVAVEGKLLAPNISSQTGELTTQALTTPPPSRPTSSPRRRRPGRHPRDEGPPERRRHSLSNLSPPRRRLLPGCRSHPPRHRGPQRCSQGPYLRRCHLRRHPEPPGPRPHSKLPN